ncbi:Asp/Glu racemase [Cupriavidus basilensis OR16]|uniref:Asp/Glu racemase n=1 Tax=Cupriavidus basilensis OR16 TaxID=1127483 RepID=H1S1E1_9BURK|nr:hypothetical protein [Cupriavidus basilensis]EHP43516.1 Asp/Glu racemase [Cupriavidus basilensis OR16]
MNYRIGQIVPSSNITMEREVPAIFAGRMRQLPERFSFHSSRVRLHRVVAQELERMNRDMGRCALELAELTRTVVEYIESEGIEVKDAINFSILDNLEVGERDPLQLLEDVTRLDTAGVDTVVLSACVQMPSFAAIERAQLALGVPVTSTAVCTARQMMRRLGLEAVAPDAGAYLGSKAGLV